MYEQIKVVIINTAKLIENKTFKIIFAVSESMLGRIIK
jgi:hypothetical protein